MDTMDEEEVMKTKTDPANRATTLARVTTDRQAGTQAGRQAGRELLQSI